ncbi:MAG TPA: ATP-dependent RecD-like DNA helicase, partial [Anaerolineae bacterium]|nr:ATP-dependent RecD-like DNA helicase [Anaerolineae bacterium]
MVKTDLETLRGIVKTITFHNEDNGYTVAKIEPEGKKSIIAVTGYIKQLSEGETVVLRGYWVDDPRWGKQFKFQSYESVIPSSLEGIKRFLSSKFIKGIGPVYAGRIVDTFGRDTIKVLDETPELLEKVPGLGHTKVKAVIDGWARHRRIRDIMIFLQAHDISEAYAARIYEKYDTDTIDKMRSNPYRLIKDIRGIGFVRADQLAMKLGIAKTSPERVKAGIMHCLDEFVEKGHVYVPLVTLLESAAERLDLDVSVVMEALEYLKKYRAVIADNERVYRAALYDYESELSQRLKLTAGTSRLGSIPGRQQVELMVTDIEHKRNISFAPLQREAIIQSALSNMLIITGGPGTGKTTTVLGIIDIFQRLHIPFLLCAPTGRAAKRLSEATGREAKTIHRLLEYNPKKGTFTKNEGDPLGAHAVIMDEASMVDTVLMTEFMRSVTPYTTLIIVGDVDQLPSIGPGSILRDMISSGKIPTIRLTEIFRQAASSRIVRCAHRINSGEMPYSDNDPKSNFFFIRINEPSDITSTIVDMVARRLPARYRFDPLEDIQVLSPMHKSETGVEHLNILLQERLNPFRSSRPEIHQGGWVYREGDKVMQVRNNYDKMVFNGDIGRIVEI